MYLKFDQVVLEVLQFEEQIILCQIRIAPRFIKYFEGCPPQKTCRWMHPEDWASFDEGLKKILSKKKDNSDLRKEWKEQFILNGTIKVDVKTSSLPLSVLCRCFSDQKLSTNEVAFALECTIKYEESVKKELEYCVDKEGVTPKREKENEKSLEYEPQPVCSQPDNNESVILVVDYTPSKKTASSPTLEEPYSPKPIGNISGDKISRSPSPVPAYNAACISKRNVRSSVGSTDDEGDEDAKRKKKFLYLEKHLRKKSGTKQVGLKQNKEEKECREQVVNEKITETGREFERTPERSDSKNVGVKSERKTLNEEAVRRSKRPITKVTRLIEQDYLHASQTLSSKKPRKRNSRSPPSVSKEKKKFVDNLFGSDDGDETNYFVKSKSKTPSSLKKARKRKDGINCAGERQTMNVWLSKKGGKESEEIRTRKGQKSMEKLKKGRRSKSVSPTPSAKSPPIVYPTCEEMCERMRIEKEQMVLNHQLAERLKEMAGPIPEKVETLSLQSMSADELVKTFSEHKEMLDKIYNEREPVHTLTHNGIDHCFVFDLIKPEMHEIMVKKLDEVYAEAAGRSTLLVSMFFNAMLPEWLLAIYAKKYNFTRDGAIKQLEAQRAYNLYVQSQLGSSFALDF